MHRNILVDLCRASDQANNLLLSELERLNSSELMSDHSLSQGSVWKLLIHMLIVETHYSRASQAKLDHLLASIIYEDALY